VSSRDRSTHSYSVYSHTLYVHKYIMVQIKLPESFQGLKQYFHNDTDATDFLTSFHKTFSGI